MQFHNNTTNSKTIPITEAEMMAINDGYEEGLPKVPFLADVYTSVTTTNYN